MTNTSRSSATAAAALLLMVMMSTPTDAQPQDEQPRETVAMRAFLESWLVQSDLVDTVVHFSSSDQAMELVPTYIEDHSDTCWSADAVAQRTDEQLPLGVACGYWHLLDALWPDAGGPDGLGVDNVEDLLADQEELRAFLDENLQTKYVEESSFIVFSATDPIELNAFDAGFSTGGYGQLAQVLKPSKEHPILTMIVDFKHAQLKHIGPLVTFWDEESSNGKSVWRIQALGAFPEN